MLDQEEIEQQMALWRRSFVDWSQSEFGFYVGKRPDPTHRRKFIYETSPVVWCPHQAAVLSYLFTLDKNGKIPHQEVWWIDVGQSGKSLLQAAVAQWCGMFHEQEAEVQLAANSKNQAEMRVYRALYNSLARHPWLDAIATIAKGGIEFHKTRNIVSPMPLKASTQAGGTPVFRGFDEIWDYEGNEARDFFGEIKESPATDFSIFMVTSYPGYEDTDGPLNDTLNQFFGENGEPLEGVRRAPQLEEYPLYVMGHIAIWWNHDALLYPWHSPEFLARQKANPAISAGQYLRLWEARRVMREDNPTPMERWDACEDPELEPLGRDDRDIPMVIGVDIGLKFAASACSARGYDVATKRYPLLGHKIWNPRSYSKDSQPDFVELAMQWILDMHRRHRVVAVRFDPSQFEHAAAQLERKGVTMEKVTQNISRTQADTNYRVLIMTRMLRNYSQVQDAREHLMHAIWREGATGTFRIEKRKATHQNDFAVADSMACQGVTEHQADFERLLKKHSDFTYPKRRNIWTRIYRMNHGQRS